MDANNADVQARVAALRAIVRSTKRALIAYSGGVDSSVVAKLACEELGADNALAVIARSPSLSETELRDAQALAKAHNIPLRVMDTYEHQNSAYQANSSSRCYYCKQELYSRLKTLMDGERFQVMLDGANLDDTQDHRPGRNAAAQYGVRSPLIEAAFNKQAVRELAASLALPNHDKPAAPCLASRIPYGIAVTPKALKQIEQAETYLKQRFKLRILRVRYHHNLARIEVPRDDFLILCNHGAELYQRFREFGFSYVSLDLLGFRSGSLNERKQLSAH